MAATTEMYAVVLHGPRDIRVEKKPLPKIEHASDAVIKVLVSGICGSELHPYRGHQKTTYGHTMGHEFTGIVTEVGEDVKKFEKGQRVIGLFSSCCSECWFCQHGYTNRCRKSLALGTAQINGCQAEYVRIPDAEGTLRLAPEGVADDLLVMMSDIFPTGYYGAMRAISALQWNKQPLDSAVIVCLGCGIVGLCAIMTAVYRGVGTVFCVDSVEDRLEQAKLMGGIPLQLGVDDINAAVMKATDDRGADAVVESVGNKPALRSGFDILRQCGVLSSVGFHQSEIPFTALEGYQKNINFNMGRAPVGAIFDEALPIFIENKDKFEDFITHRLPLGEAAKGYDLFDRQKARKVVMRPGNT